MKNWTPQQDSEIRALRAKIAALEATPAVTYASAYITSLAGAVLTDQTTGQTIGTTGARLTKLWVTDITVTNAITGAVTGNAGTVTNGVYTTDAGTVFLAPAGDGSSLSGVLHSLSGAVLTDQTAAQTIGATGARLTKLWATDVEVTNKIAGSITGNADGTAGAVSGLTITPGASISGANTGDQTGGTPALTLGTANTAGASTNFIRRDDTILVFDATAPSTQAFGDAATVGVATVAARRDHKHAMMAAPTSITGNAATATKLAATKTIAGVAFDGSANIDIPIDGLSDVAVATPALNDHLIWNGTNFVNAPSGTTFTFSIASFADDQSATVLIGSGNWKTTGNINFTATYNNGPPTSCTIAIGGTGSVTWANPLTLSTPYTSGASAENTAYPAAKDTTITFTLTPIKGANPTSVVTHTFRNNVKYGTSTATSWDSTAVNAFSGTTLSSTYTGTIGSITASTNDYVMLAHPSSYTSIHATGFLFNGVACPFQSAATVSVTNSAGFTENYKVYRSTNKNLGTSNLVVSTSSNIIDPIYYGISTTGSSFTEGVVEALASNAISNTKGRTFSVSPSTNDYIVYALPTRLGTVTFTVGGFSGGFNAPETVSVTNVNGYAEDYYVYGSVNKNLGTVSVVVT